MTSSIMTIEDFCKEIDVTPYILKYFSKTYNIDLFSDAYLIDKNSLWLNAHDVVTPKFIKEFTELKQQLKEYENDYFPERTVEKLAKKIGQDIKTVLDCLNKSKSTILCYKLSEEGDLISISTVKKISSYQILSDIQLESRENLINKNSNN